MQDDHEFLGRALVSAAGLTPRARAMLMLKDSFRVGGSRVFSKRQAGRGMGSDMVTRYQPLPSPKQPDMTVENRNTERTDDVS